MSQEESKREVENLCRQHNGRMEGDTCVLDNPGVIIMPRKNPGGQTMPTSAEGGLSRAERNYPRPDGKKFPVSRKTTRK